MGPQPQKPRRARKAQVKEIEMSFNFDEIVVVKVDKQNTNKGDSGERASKDVGWSDIEDQTILYDARHIASLCVKLTDEVNSLIEKYETFLSEAAFYSAIADKIATPSDADCALLLSALKKASQDKQEEIYWNLGCEGWNIRNKISLERAYNTCREAAERGINPTLALKTVWEQARQEFKGIAAEHEASAKDCRTAWRLINLNFPGMMVKGRSENASANGIQRAQKNHYSPKQAKKQAQSENADMT
jgi:hypothetical protein